MQHAIPENNHSPATSHHFVPRPPTPCIITFETQYEQADIIYFPISTPSIVE